MKAESLVFSTVSALLLGCGAHITFDHDDDDNDDTHDTPSSQLVSQLLNLELAVDKRVVLPDERSAVVMVRVGGGQSTEDRGPVTMAIVLDASVSMVGDKIEQARQAAHQLVDRLREGDVVSVISYADEAEVLLANYPVGQDRSAAHEAVERLASTGATCISCGLEAAYAVLADSDPALPRRVVVLSDGNANRGVADSGGLRMMSSLALELNAAPTSTIGLGYDYNETLMSAISAGGAGSYYFLPNETAIADVLDRELAALAQLVASNVEIELIPHNGVQFGPLDVPSTSTDDGRVILQLGQLPSGATRELLIPIQLPPGELGSVVEARVVYRDAQGSNYMADAQASMERSSDVDEVMESQDIHVQARIQEVQAAQEVERALAEFQEGQREQATRRLRDQARVLEDNARSLQSQELQTSSDQVEVLLDQLGAGDSGDEGDDRSSEPSEEELRGLYLHNQARTEELLQGVPPAEMYHETTVPAE